MSIAHENVKARYQNINRLNEKKLEDRKREVYKKTPKIEELELRITKLNLETLKAAITLDNSDKERNDIEKKKNKLQAEVNSLLLNSGFKEDYLNSINKCEKCKDTGYIDAKTRCDCYNKYILEERTKDSGLSKNSGTFETFETKIYNNKKQDGKVSQEAYMKELKKRAEEYADSFPSENVLNFVLMGKPGTGKTFLIESILNRVLAKGFVGEYYTASRLFTIFYNHRMGERVDLNLLMELPLLVIDDLGTEIMTKNVTVEYFYNLINERSAKGLHTIIATNINSQNIIDRYGDRVFSRLSAKNSETILIPERFGDIRI